MTEQEIQRANEKISNLLLSKKKEDVEIGLQLVSQLDNKAISLEALKLDKSVFNHLSEDLKLDSDMQKMALLADNDVLELQKQLKQIDKKYQEADYDSVEREEFLDELKEIRKKLERTISRGYLMEFVNDELKDFDFVLKAVRNDGRAIQHAGEHKQNEKVIVEAILSMVRYGGFYSDFNKYIDVDSWDILRESLDLLKSIGNKNTYEELLSGLSFSDSDGYRDGLPLIGLEQWEQKYGITSYDNKAFGVLIYRLILDCPDNASIDQSLIWENLTQWFIWITDCVGDGIEDHDGHKHLDFITPKEFYNSIDFILWLYEFEWDGVKLFEICSDFINKHIPKDRFRDVDFVTKYIKNNLNKFPFEFIPNELK